MIGSLDKSTFDPEKNYDEFYQDHKFEPMIEELSYVADEVVPRVAWAVDVARDIKAQTILDMGCLDGFAALTLANRLPGVKTEGMDLSEPGIKLANERAFKRNLQAVFLNASIEEWAPHPSYDLILLFEVIEHFKDVDKAMANIKGSLKPGGTLLVSTPDAEGTYGIGNDDACHLQIYTYRTTDRFEAVPQGWSGKPVISLPNYLESQGFEVVETAVWNDLVHCRAVLR